VRVRVRDLLLSTVRRSEALPFGENATASTTATRRQRTRACACGLALSARWRSRCRRRERERLARLHAGGRPGPARPTALPSLVPCFERNVRFASRRPLRGPLPFDMWLCVSCRAWPRSPWLSPRGNAALGDVVRTPLVRSDASSSSSYASSSSSSSAYTSSSTYTSTCACACAAAVCRRSTDPLYLTLLTTAPLGSFPYPSHDIGREPERLHAGGPRTRSADGAPVGGSLLQTKRKVRAAFSSEGPGCTPAGPARWFAWRGRSSRHR
jgi:hypothetical protein